MIQAAHNKRFISRGRTLEWITLGCCLLETGIGISCGVVHNSVALLSFGTQSLIEIVSASVAIWRLGHDFHRHRVERRSLRVEAYCFFTLTFVVSADSIRALSIRESPTPSLLGIALAIFSLFVMPLLSVGKRSIGFVLASDTVKADAAQSALCGYFALILLAGLSLNQFFGLWWADSVASLVMVPIIVNEGRRALHGKACIHC